MFSHRSPAQLLARRAEAKSLSLVCRCWRRVLVPITLETVILNSELEAKTFASMLRLKHVGPYIKKLRIEGGYGRFIHSILSNMSGLAFISVSLDIPSKDKAGGLCSGLKLINPKHLILRDSKVLGNQGVINVIDVLIECMTSVWSNLVRVPLDMFLFSTCPNSSNQVSYEHPYDEYVWLYNVSRAHQRARHTRAADLARALTRIPKLQTVYVPRVNIVQEDDVVLNAIKNPSLQRIYSRIYWISDKENFPGFEEAFKTYPRLREVVHFPLPGPWTSPVYVAVGDRD